MKKTLLLIAFLFSISTNASADFLEFAGNFTTNTSTGNQSITGVGFQPKVVFFITTVNTSVGNADSLIYGFGVATSSTARWSMSAASMDNLGGNSNDDRAFNSDECISVNVNASILLEADFVSMDSDGFTINITTADATGRIVGYLALGGSDLSVKVGTWDLPTTTGTGKTVTGVGFQPSGMLVGNTLSANTEGNVSSYIYMLSSVVSSSASWVNQIVGIDNVSPTQEERYWASSGFIWRGSTSTPTHQASFTSFDSDGFTYNLTTTNANQPRMGYVAFAGINVAVGSFTQKTSTGTDAKTGVGFQPSAILFSGNQDTAASGTFQAEAKLHIGVATSTTERFAMSGSTANGVTNESANRRTVTNSTITIITDGTPTLDAEADLNSFDSDGFTLNYTTADTFARNISYLAFGAISAGGSPKKGAVIITS